MQRKKGFVHIRLDMDLVDHVGVIKARPGGISRFVNDKIREDKEKLDTTKEQG